MAKEQTETQETGATETPSQTDWKQAVIPEDADGPAKSYAGKTVGDFLEAHNTLNKSFQSKSEALKERERELEQTRAELEKLKPKETPKKGRESESKPSEEPEQPKFDPANPPKGFVNSEEFAKALNKAAMEYMSNGGLSQETADEVLKFNMMGRTDLADFLELRKNQRADIKARFEDSVPDLDLHVLEEWITSKDSPYSDHAAKGMIEMIQQKRVGWIPEVWEDMQKHIGEGGRFTGGHSGKTFGNVEPVLRGDPSGGHANPGFQNKGEYDKAVAEAEEARQRGNSAPMNAVREKYEKTPEKIRATFY